MRGWILFNGNIGFDVDFVSRHSERILHSHHVDPAVRDWRKVLLVTAAWGAHEHKESHVKEALTKIGVRQRFEGGHERNMQNLSIWHQWSAFMEAEPDLHRAFREKEDVIARTKEFYRRKNGDFLKILRDQTRWVRATFPGETLANILAYDVVHQRSRLPRLQDRQLLYHYCCQDVQDTLAKIVENDRTMLAICREIEQYFRGRSRLDENTRYIATRDELRGRVLSANSILMFGGDLGALLTCLQFFRLHEVFHEAIWRGTNYYAVSAGSMVLAEKIIVYDDFDGGEHDRPRQEFEFHDSGLALVTKVTLFPHCMDRIQTDDQDNLAYLAHRFASGPCVGLNQDSFLLVEPVSDGATGSVRERFVSVGEKDGVYVFDGRGNKTCRRFGEEVTLEGSP